MSHHYFSLNIDVDYITSLKKMEGGGKKATEYSPHTSWGQSSTANVRVEKKVHQKEHF